MLPTFRLFFVAVAIVIAALAIAARGLVTPSEGYTRIGDVPGVGRALVQQAIVHHPEARRMHVLASARRADELERLRDLPAAPTRTEDAPAPAPAEAAPSDPIAELLKQLPAETAPEPPAIAEAPPEPIVTGALAPAAPSEAPESPVAPAPDPPDTAAPPVASDDTAPPPEARREVAVAPATDPAEIAEAPRADPAQQANLPSESDGLAAQSSERAGAIVPALPRPRPAVADKQRGPIVQVVRRKPRPPRIAVPRTPRIAATRARVQRAAARRPAPAPTWSTNSGFAINPSQASGQ